MTATDAVERFLRSLDELDDPAIFISTRGAADLRARAETVDAQAAAEVPLRGLVFGVKDNIDVAGLPTTAACPAYAYLPERSAHVVTLLEAAGAIAVGKTNLDQFATGLVGTRSPHGTPRNPFAPEFVPGGSSSGSAVAVARGLVDFALGTDTAGSGRVPAAFCGIIGLKPTPGRLSCDGVVPAVRSIDCVSVLAPDIALCARLLAAMDGFDPADPFCRHPPVAPIAPTPLRFGVADPETLARLGCTDTTVRAYEGALTALRGPQRTIDLDPFMELGDELYGGPWVAERTAAVGGFVALHGSDCDPVVAGVILGGSAWSAVDQHEAGYRRVALARSIDEVFDTVDIVALPTTPSVPTLADVESDPVGVNSALGRFTTFANLADLCAVTVPVGPSATGSVRASITVYARAWHEDWLIAVAAGLTGVAAPPPVGPSAPAQLRLVVAGAHLRGQPLEHQLLGLGATWEATTRTAPNYRLYALADSTPAKPGLVFDPTGVSIEVDTWLLSPDALGRFLTMVPPPLALGTVSLQDGSRATGFVCEPRALDGAIDVTELGGWRAYQASR